MDARSGTTVGLGHIETTARWAHPDQWLIRTEGRPSRASRHATVSGHRPRYHATGYFSASSEDRGFPSRRPGCLQPEPGDLRPRRFTWLGRLPGPQGPVQRKDSAPEPTHATCPVSRSCLRSDKKTRLWDRTTSREFDSQERIACRKCQIPNGSCFWPDDCTTGAARGGVGRACSERTNPLGGPVATYDSTFLLGFRFWQAGQIG